MPSFAFVSTANAFVLRGGIPIFVDIREDTLNVDESLVAQAVTEKTRCIVPVHYSGVACEMESLLALGKKHNIAIIEDGAQGLMAEYKGRPLGSLGEMATISFHDTKNIICGEGGCLVFNQADWVKRAEVILEKGTDRSSFLRGEIAKYEWCDIGSSFALSELNAALLWSQLENAEPLIAKRRALWQRYHEELAGLEGREFLRRPVIPESCVHNGHLYYLLAQNEKERNELLVFLRKNGIEAFFHFVPLHSSPAGKRFGRCFGDLPITESLSARIIRLPLWPGMTDQQFATIVTAIKRFYGA